MNKKISLDADNVSLDWVLAEITNQTGINFSYNNKSIQSEKTTTLHVRDQSLQQVLNGLSSDYKLEYKIVKEQIILKPLQKKEDQVQQFTISGYLHDKESGETLPGATVLADNSGMGTITNAY